MSKQEFEKQWREHSNYCKEFSRNNGYISKELFEKSKQLYSQFKEMQCK